MKRILLLAIFALFPSADAFAHQAFTLVSSERKTIKESELAGLEKTGTVGKTDKTNLIFAEKEIRLVALTGPEDNMLSYRIQGIRNPNLVVPSGATLRILFVNIDGGMRHDIRFGHIAGEFPIAPPIEETAGSERLPARAENGTFQAEEIVVKATAVPEPKINEVLVKMKSVSLNYRDLLVINGIENWKPSSARIPVSDGVGEVIAICGSVSRWQILDGLKIHLKRKKALYSGFQYYGTKQVSTICGSRWY